MQWGESLSVQLNNHSDRCGAVHVCRAPSEIECTYSGLFRGVVYRDAIRPFPTLLKETSFFLFMTKSRDPRGTITNVKRGQVEMRSKGNPKVVSHLLWRAGTIRACEHHVPHFGPYLSLAVIPPSTPIFILLSPS